MISTFVNVNLKAWTRLEMLVFLFVFRWYVYGTFNFNRILKLLSASNGISIDGLKYIRYPWFQSSYRNSIQTRLHVSISIGVHQTSNDICVFYNSLQIIKLEKLVNWKLIFKFVFITWSCKKFFLWANVIRIFIGNMWLSFLAFPLLI